MTEQIISPGLFFQETDQSAYAQGPVVRGLAVVGPTEKGTAYVPTDITTYSQYVALFGANSDVTYLPQTVFSYLQSGQTVKVTRVLGNGGWQFTNVRQLCAIVTGSKLLTVFHPSKNDNATTADMSDTTVGGTYAAFNISIRVSSWIHRRFHLQ